MAIQFGFEFSLGFDPRPVKPVTTSQRLGFCAVGNDDCPSRNRCGLSLVFDDYLVITRMPVDRGQSSILEQRDPRMIAGNLDSIIGHQAGPILLIRSRLNGVLL